MFFWRCCTSAALTSRFLIAAEPSGKIATERDSAYRIGDPQGTFAPSPIYLFIFFLRPLLPPPPSAATADVADISLFFSALSFLRVSRDANGVRRCHGFRLSRRSPPLRIVPARSSNVFARPRGGHSGVHPYFASRRFVGDGIRARIVRWSCDYFANARA